MNEVTVSNKNIQGSTQLDLLENFTLDHMD